ncbi:S1/P1 nuclease [Vibrio europaeus]|uniref:S1/P1 nuclease n=1 Tax=Vibrio europaeus TaxID=300876 RepID=UPI0018A7BB75|nr:S1/P1 nuclease [Vibrio europaeus]MDC5813051.1 S1/P1 nuclease [Vibrio europaeus]QPG36054.1 S1/P1 nuclease [Vibrio europaeus]
MKTLTLLRISLASLAYLICGSAWAFGAAGHEVICEIAYQTASPKTKQAIDSIMSQERNPKFKTFSKSCVWPDYLGVLQKSRKKDHYVNVPRSWTHIEKLECPEAARCLFTGIKQDVDVLRSNQTNIEDKLVALKFLGHWIGDLHQPLHISFSDDRGGNVVLLAKGFGCDKNLHSVWDTCIVEDLMDSMIDTTDKDKRKEFALALIKSVDSEEAKYEPSNVQLLAWANESLSIARMPEVNYCIYDDELKLCKYSESSEQYVPGQERVLNLTSEYEDEFQDIVKQRLLAGGARLALLLNSIFDPSY